MHAQQETLREEGVEGLWNKAVGALGGGGEREGGGREGRREEGGETASARFAHYTVEVRRHDIVFDVSLR